MLLNMDKLHSIEMRFKKLNMVINDTIRLTPLKIISHCQMLFTKYRIDYFATSLQKMA